VRVCDRSTKCNRVGTSFIATLVILAAFALTASGCITSNDESSADLRLSRLGTAPPSPARSSSQKPQGISLSAGEERGKTTYVEGTGRFIGDQPASPTQFDNIGGDAGVTLNLANVPAPQAAKIVLGDILSVRYTIAPGIEGKMTIQTPNPVTKSEVINLFQTALRANNATLVNANGIYKIVPLDQASVGARISVTDVPRSEDKVGSGLHIVSLKYVSASEIRRIIEPISPRGGIVRADDTRNTITLSGNDHEIAGMMEAISIFDVDIMKGMSFALVPVRISDPAVIAEELRTVFSSEREGPMAGMVQFLPNKRLGAILIASAQPKYLQRAETWVRRLDAQAEGSEKQFFTFAVQNRRAQEIVDVLQGMFSNEIAGGRGPTQTRNVAPQYSAASVQSQQMQQQSSASLGMTAVGGGMPVGGGVAGGGLGTTSTGFGVTQLQQGTAGSANANRQTRQVSEVGRDETTGEPRIKLAADEAKNVILIEATPVDYRRIMRVIGTLDVIPNQVLIEAMIAEITLNDDLKFGVRSFLNGGKNSATFSDDPGGAVASVFPGFSYAFTATKFAATLNTLNQITDVNIISSPSLTVMDSKTAVLQVGDQVPITTQSAVSVLTTGAPVVNSVSYRDTGVILSITPRINESGRVLLDIEQEVSSVSTTTTSTINSPTITERRVKTSVVVNNGDALVLGGMIQNSKTITKSQIPLVGDIPILGSVLSNKDNQKSKTELIVLITPHVIRNLNEARQVTDEFRRELTASFHGSAPSKKMQESVRRIIE
jgi:general secretion pathway protein D